MGPARDREESHELRPSSSSASPAAAALPVSPRVARAQRYPTRQITVVVPFAAGGIADAVARLTAPKLSERLGQAVVVENRAGAGGNLGARMVAGSAADGYTLLATTSALAVNDSASRNKGYATEDLRAVAIVADSPDILAVHPRNPAEIARASSSPPEERRASPLRAPAPGPARTSARNISSARSRR